MDCFKVLGNIKNGGLRPSIQDESREIVILLQFCHVCPIFQALKSPQTPSKASQTPQRPPGTLNPK